MPSASETTASHDETLCVLLLPYFKMLIAYDQDNQLRQVVNSDMPSKNWLRDDLRAMAVENPRVSGRDVDKIDCFMSVLQGIGPQAACCRRRRPVARTIARTIARTCCRKHARARARARARPNAHCPRPHTRPHKGDRGSRSGGRRRRGQRAMARRV